MKKIIFYLLIIISLQSCYFGAGVVEIDLPGNFDLFGNNSKNEAAIWLDIGEYSSEIIVNQTVFAVGYNDDFIIAKSHSKNKILYHIIEVKKGLKQANINLSFEQYKFNREHLNVPYDLNFTIVFHEIAKN